MSQSLFKACKNIIRSGATGTQDVGGFNVKIEYYTQDDIDANKRNIENGSATACTFGDSDENNVVLVAGDEITIPEGFTLTPAHPKKSLVIIANTLTNNGTISMTAKAPYVTPHDWYILGKVDGYSEKIIIPALAGNQVGDDALFNVYNKYPSNSALGNCGLDGNNGINRQCGSGGTGITTGLYDYSYRPYSGSGYAFGGGAGSGGIMAALTVVKSIIGKLDVDKNYPSKGGKGIRDNNYFSGGVGNPNGYTGASYERAQNYGCGGRIIIFCNEFINNGNVISNGTSSENGSDTSHGGASGAGAIDIFCNNYNDINLTLFQANGGVGAKYNNSNVVKSGNGGNGCITLSNGTNAPLWTMPNLFKPQRKKFTQENWAYLFGEYASRLNEEV